jgi:hypothetical protein
MLTSRKSFCRYKHVPATNEQKRSSLLNLLWWSSFTSSLFIRLSVCSTLLNELSVLSQTAGTLLKVVQVWCPFASAADVSFPLFCSRAAPPWPARCTLTESGIFVLIYFKLFVLFVGQTTQAFWTHRSSQLLHLKHSCIGFSVVSSHQFEICVPSNGQITFLRLARVVSTRPKTSEPKESNPFKILLEAMCDRLFNEVPRPTLLLPGFFISENRVPSQTIPRGIFRA